ncbi:hypothetical protein ARGLB_037_00660 [Arthrobacter globiformis NBRC 12137]|uniref:Uncharacterized protein n=1 Tax=Arthrobacter globiformis (strain ATCC 8010 / DSM 20124 / JCM 1332 / NBRC 12137 / NCIMB 8907 / NRRL B-2979 / 168) TaxID=1077972 RepID=H0QKL6_ARTG1|nr:hypothetical protein ARGLB_037_00660 [Arthrobacter globiformis NBRC 12137]
MDGSVHIDREWPSGPVSRGPASELQLCKLLTVWITAVENPTAGCDPVNLVMELRGGTKMPPLRKAGATGEGTAG